LYILVPLCGAVTRKDGALVRSDLHAGLDEVDGIHERVLSDPRARAGDHVAGIVHAVVLPDCGLPDVNASHGDGW
jgi:hypothetical protein